MRGKQNERARTRRAIKKALKRKPRPNRQADECGKVAHRIECVEHGYPMSEARYPDSKYSPLPCNRNDAFYLGYIEGILDL